jgi:hypothetical protein
MGNRAVITFMRGDSAPCIYLHWNGGRASVEGFLKAARHLGLRRINAQNQKQVMDNLADLIAKHFFGHDIGMTVYRETYGQADKDNWDNGLFVLGFDMHICGRAFNRGEEINPTKTQEIYESIINRAPIFND